MFFALPKMGRARNPRTALDAPPRFARGPGKGRKKRYSVALPRLNSAFLPHRMYHSVGTPSFFHMLGASESPLRQGFRAVAPKPLYGAYRAAPLCGDPGKGRKRRYSVALPRLNSAFLPHRMYHSVGTPSFFHMLGASESPLRQGFRAVAPKPLHGAYRAAPLCGDPGKGRKKRYSVALPRLNSAFSLFSSLMV